MSQARPKLLVVDDRDRYIRLAHQLLSGYTYATRCELEGPCVTCDLRKGCTLTHAHDWAETAASLTKHPDVDVVLLDLEFELPSERLLKRPGQDLKQSRRLQGLEILARIRQTRGNLPVILMTSAEDLRFEAEAGTLEVDEFVTMAGADAFDARAMGLLIERVLSRSGGPDFGTDFVWGESKAMARLGRDASSLGRTSLPVLLLGEPGTGKSALAELVLHPATGRKGPFVTVDLAAVPDTLAAAELFGSKPGAFSGAVDRPGCFERADGGTLFLDEIGNLSIDAQRMLLVTLQTGRVARLGDGRQRPVDVKLIAATNSDLEAAVKKGEFRGDLYARLNPSAKLVMPPLRQRQGDLVLLIESFVRKIFSPEGKERRLLLAYAEAAGIPVPGRMDLTIGADGNSAEDALTFVLSKKSFAEASAHLWRGNVRELELFTASAAIFALMDALAGAEKHRAATDAAPRTIPIPAKLVRELLAASSIDSPAAEVTDDRFAARVHPGQNLRDTMRDMERQLFKTLFLETGGDFQEMARRLVLGDPGENERAIRLRFNQLGLRVRQLKNR